MSSDGKSTLPSPEPLALAPSISQGCVPAIPQQLTLQRQLQLSEWRYRCLVEATASIVWSTPPSGEFDQPQPEWSAFTGQTFDELKGWGWLKAVHPEDREATARDWSAALSHARPFSGEYRLRNRAGVYRNMMARAVPIVDDEGEIIEWMGIDTDITDRRSSEDQLAERERFYRQLIEGMPHFTWTCDIAGNFDYLCQRWFDYSGSTTRDPLPTGSPTHVHPEDQQCLRDAWERAVATGRDFHLEVRLRRRDGVYRWFDAYASPIRGDGNQIVKWFGCSIDIDERKKAEEALRRSEMRLRSLNGSLERRVRERTAEVEARSAQLRAVALDLAETESRERKRLAQLLHDHFQQLISAAKLKVGLVRRSSSEKAAASLRQIESLLEEAIEASRSLATELSPPVLHDGGLLPALEWLARRMQRNHGLTVKLALKPECEPDNEQVRTVIFDCVRELLFNVSKHANTSAAELSVDMMSEGLLHVRVADHGKGFNALQEEVKKRVDGSFGLFSIRERLSQVGGLMRIDSAPGKGTRIDLTVPSVSAAKTGPHIPEQATLTQGQTPQRLRVIIADDHKVYREGLISVFAQEPLLEVVAQASDGLEAIDLCEKLKPDVLVLDITMPRLNGVQVAAALSHSQPGLYIIGLSMHSADDMAGAMRSAGAADYYSKGGEAEELLLANLRALAQRRLGAAESAEVSATR